jgi:hypothetical protein
MKVLVACEFSGIVRDAFAKRGHDAWSCDLLPSERPGQHIQGEVEEILGDGWDMMIAHPECTYLTVANTYMKRGCSKYTAREAISLRKCAVDFFMLLVHAPIKRIAIENPIGVMSTIYRKPDQVVHPWQFGEDASKATCLWLNGLPKLKPTNILPGGRTVRRSNQTPSGQNKLGPSPTRAMERSRTYQGIADAMAEQWGSLETGSGE